jgi:hypothetical protein
MTAEGTVGAPTCFIFKSLNKYMFLTLVKIVFLLKSLFSVGVRISFKIEKSCRFLSEKTSFLQIIKLLQLSSNKKIKQILNVLVNVP